MSSVPPPHAVELADALAALERCRAVATVAYDLLDSIGELEPEPTVLRTISARMVGMGRIRAMQMLLTDAEQQVRHALVPLADREITDGPHTHP